MIFLALICFALVSLVVICSASWVILHRSKTEDMPYTAPEDTNPCFQNEFTYNGKVQTPGFNDKGSAVYGKISDYKITWVGGTLANNTKIEPADTTLQGVAAGTHYYKIVDTVTGQVVSKKHAVVINKATLTGSVEETTPDVPVFPGTEKEYTVTWTGVNGEVYYDLDKSYQVLAEDASPSDNQICTATFKCTAAEAAPPLDDTTLNEMFYNNYDVKKATINATAKVFSTCYSRTGTTNTYYVNIDQALVETAKANKSGTTLIAMQSFTYSEKTYSVKIDGVGDYEHNISSGKSVGSNVTLNIPYAATSSFNGKESTLNREGSTINPIKKNLVTLSGELTNNGTITVGGVLGRVGQGVSGSTTEDYSELHMNENAKIVSTGKLNVFGYVTNGGNALVDATEGTITMPFVIYDYYGGSHTTGAFKKGNISPFSIFDMPNIQATLKCYGGDKGSTIIGYADLHTSGVIGDKHNTTDIKIFGSSNALFNMSNGYAIYEYVPKDIPVEAQADVSKTEYEKKLTAGGTKITLNGDTVSGDMYMTIVIDLVLTEVRENVTLKSVHFPISHKIELNLTGNHNYTFTSKYKFMPGSVLNISEEAKVTVDENAGLLFYGSFTGEDASEGRKTAYSSIDHLKLFYFSGLTSPAQCNLAGTLTVNGALGGKITPSSANAVLDISNAKALEMTEKEGLGTADMSNVSGLADGSAFGFNHQYTETQKANGTVMISTLGATQNKNLSNKKYIVEQVDEKFVWLPTTANVYLKTNGGSLASETITVRIGKDGILQSDWDAIPIPELSGVEFDGWYTDAEQTVKLENRSQIIDDITLYAKWNATTCTVTYASGKAGVAFESETVVPGPYSGYPKSSVDDHNPDVNYYLKGWMLNGVEYSLTDEIPIEGDCTLTAVWGTKHKIAVSINLDGITSGRVTVGAKEYNLAGAYEYWVNPNDSVKVTAEGTGKGTKVIFFYVYTNAKVTIGSESVSDKNANGTSLSKTLTALAEGGTTNVSVAKE